MVVVIIVVEVRLSPGKRAIWELTIPQDARYFGHPARAMHLPLSTVGWERFRSF
jgi:hypothetical protein